MSIRDGNDSSNDFESCDESIGEGYETCEEELSLQNFLKKRARSKRTKNRVPEGNKNFQQLHVSFQFIS